jgi:hypothetical protein
VLGELVQTTAGSGSRTHLADARTAPRSARTKCWWGIKPASGMAAATPHGPPAHATKHPRSQRVTCPQTGPRRRRGRVVQCRERRALVRSPLSPGWTRTRHHRSRSSFLPSYTRSTPGVLPLTRVRIRGGIGDVNSKWPRRDGLKWPRRGLNCPGGWSLRGKLVRVVGVVPGLPDFGAESAAVGHA